MIIKFWLVFLVLMGLPASAGAAPEAPVLYRQLTGGEEDYVVQKRDTIGSVAAKKGMRWQTLARINGLKETSRLKPGMVLRINSTRIVPRELEHGLVINLPELSLYHFEKGALKRRYSLGLGRSGWHTPSGRFEIINKARNPTWVVPPSIQRAMEARGEEVVTRVPPGPGNPLGPYWMATSAPGVGIHATNRPWSIGHFVSHGCIRMFTEEIAELFPQIEVGTPVAIVYRTFKLALTPEGRVFLEAHPNSYRKKQDPRGQLEALLREHQLQDRVDWEKVEQVLKAQEGLAVDVTKTLWSSGTKAAAPVPPLEGPRPGGPSQGADDEASLR